MIKTWENGGNMSTFTIMSNLNYELFWVWENFYFYKMDDDILAYFPAKFGEYLAVRYYFIYQNVKKVDSSPIFGVMSHSKIIK